MKARLQNFLPPNQLECQPFLNTTMSTSHNMLEAITGPNINYILAELEENFPPVTPNPEDSMQRIMYRSGQRSVVEWLVRRMEEVRSDAL